MAGLVVLPPPTPRYVSFTSLSTIADPSPINGNGNNDDEDDNADEDDADKGVVQSVATSTGTTIVGRLFKVQVVLGADKNCEKAGSILSTPPFLALTFTTSESICCCGAGTAAYTVFTTTLISSNMELVARPFDGQETRSRHRHELPK